MQLIVLVAVTLLLSALAIYLIITEPPSCMENDMASGDEESGPNRTELDSPRKNSFLLWYAAASVAVNLGLALFMRLYYNDSLLTVFNVILAATILWATAWIDRKSLRIPNRILLVGLVLRILLILIEILCSPSEYGYLLISSFVAAAAAFLATLLCRLIAPNSIGFGDIKLLALMGFILRTERIWAAVFFTMILSFFYSLYLLVFKKATRKTEIPFAPLLLIGSLLAFFLTSV